MALSQDCKKAFIGCHMQLISVCVLVKLRKPEAIYFCVLCKDF